MMRAVVGVLLTYIVVKLNGAKPPPGASAKFDQDGLYNLLDQFYPWDEYRHNPMQVTQYPEYEVPPPPGPLLNGSIYNVPKKDESPDFRLPEPPHTAFKPMFYAEMNRYYRITPRLHLEWWAKAKKHEHPALLQCYCVCVYKRLTPLSMGAVLTTRHIMTTAVATDMVVRRYRKKYTLENILGAWYETHHVGHTNSVIYTTPVRIHYHPRWNPPELTNRSVPFPCVFDLAVWAAERTFFGSNPRAFTGPNMVVVCNRCGPPNDMYGGNWVPPTLAEKDLTIFVGVHMVMDIGRVPYPWFKYAIRTKSGKRSPCPKTEWGWFHCIEHVGMYPKYGVDNGGPLHVSYEGYSKRYDGLAGINSLSMRLRSVHPISYFTVLERHPVLDFLYSAYCGRLKYIFLDNRFNNTQWKAPRLRPKNNNRLQPASIAHKLGHDWAKENKKYTPIWWR